MTGTNSPGASPFAPLSQERIAAARAQYGHSVDQYIKFLNVGDPLADALVRSLEERELGDPFPLVTRAVASGIASVDNAPPELIALFEQLDDVPPWVDWERLKIGSGKIIRNALLPTMSLAVYALPHAYLATGNKPLAFSNTLLANTARRYAITTRFVTEAFMPGSLRRHADGFKLAVITRILHARIRRRILTSGRWDPALGVPLNQAHMAMATVIFSSFVLEGMRRLGARFTTEDTESILLVWRYIGYLMGVDSEILCASASEEKRLVDAAFSLEFDPDDDSVRLCRSLFDAAPGFMRIERPRVARLFVKLLYALSRRLLGDELADRLGYPAEKHRVLCFAGISVAWLLERFPVLTPPQLRRYMGVKFWIEQGNYDLRLYQL